MLRGEGRFAGAVPLSSIVIQASRSYGDDISCALASQAVLRFHSRRASGSTSCSAGGRHQHGVLNLPEIDILQLCNWKTCAGMHPPKFSL